MSRNSPPSDRMREKRCSTIAPNRSIAISCGPAPGTSTGRVPAYSRTSGSSWAETPDSSERQPCAASVVRRSTSSAHRAVDDGRARQIRDPAAGRAPSRHRAAPPRSARHRRSAARRRPRAAGRHARFCLRPSRRARGLRGPAGSIARGPVVVRLVLGRAALVHHRRAGHAHATAGQRRDRGPGDDARAIASVRGGVRAAVRRRRTRHRRRRPRRTHTRAAWSARATPAKLIGVSGLPMIAWASLPPSIIGPVPLSAPIVASARAATSTMSWVTSSSCTSLLLLVHSLLPALLHPLPALRHGQEADPGGAGRRPEREHLVRQRRIEPPVVEGDGELGPTLQRRSS